MVLNKASTETHVHVLVLRYGGVTPACLIHKCFPSFWSETWKKEFCLEKNKMAELINKLTTLVCLFSRYVQRKETEMPDFIRTRYFTGGPCNNVGFVGFGLFYSFMWHAWLCCVSVVPRGKNKSSTIMKKLSACEEVKRGPETMGSTSVIRLVFAFHFLFSSDTRYERTSVLFLKRISSLRFGQSFLLISNSLIQNPLLSFTVHYQLFIYLKCTIDTSHLDSSIQVNFLFSWVKHLPSFKLATHFIWKYFFFSSTVS